MTPEQSRILERVWHDGTWTWYCDENEDTVMRFLMEQGLCRAREDIAPGTYELTQLGEIEKRRCQQEREDEAREEQRKVTEKHRFFIGLFASILAVTVGAVVAWILPLLAGANGG